MRTWAFVVSAGVMLAAADSGIAQSGSQTRCEPTISNPCKPPAARPAPTLPAIPSTGNLQQRELPRLDENKIIPDIQFDRNTTFGVGQGGGILGIERKFDPKDSR